MGKPAKILFTLIALPVVLVVAAVIFILTLDPNRLKPLIKDQAAKQGIELTFSGDLGWQFYPALGVSLGAMSGTSHSGAPLFELNQASASVLLMPLFNGSIQVQGIHLEGVRAYYHVDNNGTNNWAEITLDDTEPKQQAPASGNPPAAIAINAINLKDLTLDYKDATTGDRATLALASAEIDQFNLAGLPFELDAKLQAHYNDYAPVTLSLKGPVQLDTTAQTLQLEPLQLSVQLGDQTASLRINTRTRWEEALRSEGNFELTGLNPKALANIMGVELPVTANPSALTRLSASGDYNYQPERINAKNLAITLDSTALNGNLTIDNPAQPAITTGWQLNRINLDDYLPPQTETESNTPEQTAPPTELPFEAMRALKLDARLNAGTIVASGYALTDTVVAVTADNGLIKLTQMDTTLAEGALIGKGELDARASEAKLQMTLNGRELQVGPLLQQAAEFDQLTGPISFEADIQSHGRTDQALVDNLNLNATVRSNALQLVPINLEKTFCQAMAVLQRQQMPAHDWPELTRLQPVEVKITMQGSEVSLESLNAEIAKLTGTAEGTFNLASGRFNVPLRLTLGEFAGDIPGCLPIPNEWRNRFLPIRCKGSLDDLGVKTCLPDTKLLEDILKQKADAKLDAEKARLERKLKKEQDRAEDKLKDKAQELLDKNVKEEDREAVEDGIRNLLDQFKKKD